MNGFIKKHKYLLNIVVSSLLVVLAACSAPVSTVTTMVTQSPDTTVSTTTEILTSTTTELITSATTATTTTATTIIVTTTTTLLPSLPPEQQYAVKYSGAGGSHPYTMVADDNGNVYIAGYTGYGLDPGFANYTIIKYDSNGNRLWENVYKGQGNGDGIARSLAVDDYGNIYVTGQNNGSDTDYDYATIKYDSNGNQIWVARYNGPGNGPDAASSLVIDGTGVYVTGISTGTNSGYDFLTVKYDLNGNQLWEARYNGPENGDDFTRSLTIDDSGNVFVTGTDNGIQGDEGGSSYLPALTSPGKSKGYYATVKYDTYGKQLWVSHYKGTGTGDDLARSVKIDSSGNVYVTGESLDNDTGYGYATVKYDTTGKPIWAVRYVSSFKGTNGAFAMTLDNAGNILVTGYSSGIVNEKGVREFATIKYDTNGNQLWAARYSSPRGDSIAYSMAVDDFENVYVTGMSGFIKYDSTAQTNYATVKYDKDGNQLWAVRYSDGKESGNSGRLLALDAYGNVYITGTSRQKDSDYSAITTIKYIQKT